MFKVVIEQYEQNERHEWFGFKSEAQAIAEMEKWIDESGIAWVKESETCFEAYQRQGTENVLLMSFKVVESDEMMVVPKTEDAESA